MDNNKITQGLPTTTAVTTTTSSRSLFLIQSHGSSKNKIEMKNSKVNVNMQIQTFTAISQSHGTPSTSTKTSVASSVVDLGKASNNPKMIASSAKGSTFEEISYDPLKLHPITDDFLSVYNTTSKVQSKKMVHQDPPGISHLGTIYTLWIEKLCRF